MCTFAHRYIILWREQNNGKGRNPKKETDLLFFFEQTEWFSGHQYKEYGKYQEDLMFSNSQKSGKHRDKPNRMSDAEIMLIMILFHSGGYRCFKHFYLEYVCMHLAHLFPRRVSYNRFVELKKEVLFPLVVFIKTVLLGTCTGISFVDSTPLRVCRN